MQFRDHMIIMHSCCNMVWVGSGTVGMGNSIPHIAHCTKMCWFRKEMVSIWKENSLMPWGQVL